MILAILLVGAALLAVPAALHRPFDRIAGAEATRLSTFALVVGAASIVFGLLALAVPSVGHTLGIEAFETCRSVVGGFEPGGHIVGWIAAVAFVVIAVRVVRALLRIRRAHAVEVDAWLGTHHPRDGHDVVVLPTDDLIAFTSSRAEPPQIVISNGIAALLDEDELDAVLAHERAHLRLRHHRHLEALAVVDATFGWVPLVRSSTKHARAAIERWADEVCVEGAVGREALARALIAVSVSEHTVVAPSGDRRAILDRTACLTHPVGPAPLATRAAALAPTFALVVAAFAVGSLWIGVLSAGGVPVTGCH